MIFRFEKRVKDEAGTSEIASEFADKLAEGDVVALEGNLGCGKTFFVKRVCEKFGIASAGSPSFSIVNQYQNSHSINHFDFYRIKKEEELYDIGFDEYLNEEESITFIEWADMFPLLLPSSHYKVKFDILNETERIIRITKNEQHFPDTID